MIQACYFNLEFGDKSFDFHRYGFYTLISHPLLFDEAIIKSIISMKALGSGGDKNASPVDWNYKFSQHPPEQRCSHADQVEKMAHARNGVHSKLREKAYNLCRDYLQGSWSKISLDEFGINVLGCVLFFLSRHVKRVRIPWALSLYLWCAVGFTTVGLQRVGYCVTLGEAVQFSKYSFILLRCSYRLWNRSMLGSSTCWMLNKPEIEELGGRVTQLT